MDFEFVFDSWIRMAVADRGNDYANAHHKDTHTQPVKIDWKLKRKRKQNKKLKDTRTT